MGQPLRDEPGELDMTDIVERLKNPMMVSMPVPDGPGHSGTSIAVMHEKTVRADMLDAAYEIERLRAINHDLIGEVELVKFEERTLKIASGQSS